MEPKSRLLYSFCSGSCQHGELVLHLESQLCDLVCVDTAPTRVLLPLGPRTSITMGWAGTELTKGDSSLKREILLLISLAHLTDLNLP